MSGHNKGVARCQGYRMRRVVQYATLMVVTLHWRAHSLSVDLTSDKTSATGGCQRFALFRATAVLSSDYAKACQSLRTGALKARAF